MRLTVAGMLGALLLATGGTESPELVHSAATFTFPSDPAKVVLFVRQSGGYGGRISSMTLHADGRLVLKIGRRTKVNDEYQHSLDCDEVNRLLRLAVDHGLAEWDATAILARQLDLNNGKPFNTPEDGSEVTVLLSIDDYKRGPYELPHVERLIRFRSPNFVARHYPYVPEIHGIAALVQELRHYLQLAQEHDQ